MCEYFNKNQTLEKINEISSMHPYPIPGEPRTYNNYNQGWSDACRLISDLVQFDPPSMVAEIPCRVGDFLWSIIRPVGLHLKAKDAPYPCHVVFIGLNDSKNFGGAL